jgi:hypothetical protein
MKKFISVFILTFLFFNLFAQNIPSYVTTNGLVAWYPFNGNANDESGNGNNGESVIGNFGIDRYGTNNNSFYGNGSGTFPGSGMYISSMNNFPFGNSNRTISAWFKCEIPYQGGARTLFCYGDNTFATRYNLYLTANSIGIEYMNGLVFSNFIPDNNWHNIIATYNGSGSSGITLYLDGILLSTTILNPTSSLNTLNSFIHTIGRFNDMDNFAGNIDDIAFYNRALTQEEITALYQGSSTNSNNNGSVGINTTTPHPSAALDITDTQRGLLIPRMTASQRNNIQNPAEGLMVFQTDDSTGFWFYSGQKWNTINSKGIKGDQGEQGVKGDRGLQGPAGNGFQNGTSKGQMMYWNDSAWVTVSPGQYGQSLVYCDGVPSWGGCLPKLNTSSVGNISSTSATIGGNITNDGGSAIIARGVCWSTSQNPTIDLATKTVDGAGLGSYTSSITGLSTNSNYYVRAYATNSAGTSYGDEVSFTTLSIPLTLNNGMVAYYPFNGNANDESGNGNNGVVNGATLTTDRFGNSGKAYSFDSQTDKISLSTLNLVDASQVSITGWFKKLSNQNYPFVDGVIFAQSNGCGGADGLRLYVGNENHVYWQVEYGQCYGTGVYNNQINFSDDFWHSFTATYSKSNSTYNASDFKLYVDGLLISINNPLSNGNFINSPINNTQNSITIGNVNSGVDALIGKIDDIRIYNRVLSQEEITYLATH